MKHLVIILFFMFFMLSGSDYLVDKIKTSDPVFFLTFDLCPRKGEEQIDEKLLDFLIENKIPAVMFASGRWLMKNEKYAKKIVSYPFFYLGSHGWDHEKMVSLKPSTINNINAYVSEYIYEITGLYPAMYRVPFADLSKNILNASEKSGQFIIHYTTTSADSTFETERIIKAVEDVQKGDILLFHLNGKGKHTKEALEILLPYWESIGLTPGFLPDYIENRCVSKQPPRP